MGSTSRTSGACSVRSFMRSRPNPLVTIVDVDRALYDRGMELRASRPDKGRGLTDCISFVIMQERGFTRALSCDHHFQEAGFQALLIEP